MSLQSQDEVLYRFESFKRNCDRNLQIMAGRIMHLAATSKDRYIIFALDAIYHKAAVQRLSPNTNLENITPEKLLFVYSVVPYAAALNYTKKKFEISNEDFTLLENSILGLNEPYIAPGIFLTKNYVMGFVAKCDISHNCYG